MLQLQDIVWDELGQNDDHAVPHPGKEHGDECLAETRSRKRKHTEISGAASNAYPITPNNISQREEDKSLITLKEEEMLLQKDLWSHSYDGTSCDDDSNNVTFSSGSLEVIDLRHCLKVSHMETVGVELYKDDPILGGQGAAMGDNFYRYSLTQPASTENHLNFFNSSNRDKEHSDLLYYGWSDIENFEDVDRMFRSCDSTFGEGTNNEDDLGWFTSPQAVEGCDDALMSNLNFQGSDGNILSRSTKDHEASVQHKSGTFANENDMKLMPLMVISNKPASSSPAVGTESSLTNEYEAMSQIDNGNESLGFKKKGPIYQFVAGHSECSDIIGPRTACSDSISCQKQVLYSENESEVRSDANGYSMCIQAQLDSSNALESCSINSPLNEVSLEAISFRQLQHVMEQLDSRTKLCIRDSLYRLARSAEQRHKFANSASGSNYDNDANPLAYHGANKSTGLMDMETDTNPIDRSIAHLLFHRPSEASAIPALDLSPRFNVHGSSNDHHLMVEEQGVAAVNDTAAC
ncbi:hypothetical protein Dimus_002938 [Dionaea muscipula]